MQGTIPFLSAMVFSRPGGAFLEAISWLNDVANSCSSRSRSSAAATTKVAAEQLTARSSRSRAAGRPCGQVAKSCQELPRAAKSWKFVFLTTLIRRDVRPRGLSLQGTIPSLSAMVFSCPGGALFEGNLLAKRCGKQLRAAEVANRCKTLLPRAVKSWTLCSLMFFN